LAHSTGKKLENIMDFGQKRRALMTGASSGIGTATALVDAKAEVNYAAEFFRWF
jgi:hypothetical protein